MGSTSSTPAHDRQVALWLLACCCMIYIMVVIGGVTRLTHSGLSMVEWKPIMGVLPPMSHEEWERAFAKYKAYPEYKVRRGMSLTEFKSIFYVEYFHRLFGRSIGLVFFFPFLFFWLRGRLRRSQLPHLVGLFALGGLQGLLGWYMVKSGLINVPRVSPYRLTAHLGLAFFLYGYALWLALELLEFRITARAVADEAASASSSPTAAYQGLRRWAWVLLAMVTVMFLSGGFVAGNRAGHMFNTWPLMNGSWIPDGLFQLDPWYINFFENHLTVQFDHRMLAYTLCILLLFVIWKGWKIKGDRRLRAILIGCLAALALQVTLGITTLLWVVPIWLGAAHQAGALLVFTGVVTLVHYLRPPLLERE